MRLNRLDLTRFGKFTDLSLSFPVPTPGSPDLHVIYGANEAGKSTLLEGWLDMLFQIPVRSSMDFLHPYPSMQLGAVLDVNGQTHELLRVKKRNNSLLDASGKPLGEALLHGGLRGLDRTSYAAMFSLNRQTLDEGGESILASKGDLGELLFQASAGMTDLAAQLDELNAESEGFLNRTGRKGALRDLCAAYDDLGRQIKELDTAAAEYTRLSTERDRAKDTWHQAREASEAAQTDVIETDRRIAAMPLLPRLDRLETQIASYGALPEPPVGWLAELPELDRTETAIATRLETAKKTEAGLEAELNYLPTDEPVLNASDDIKAADLLKSAHDSALEDLPKRRGELEAKTEAVNDCLSRLGQVGADPTTLLPEARTLGRLRALIEQSSGVETACDAATRELQVAQDDAARAERRLREAGGSMSDLGGLAGLVQILRREDPLGAHDRASTELEEMEAELESALAALSPWTGNKDKLANLTPPDRADLEQLGASMTEAERAADRADDRLVQLEHTAAQARTRRDAIGTSAAVTLEEAAHVRKRRESEWSDHRAKLTDETAERFESAMRLDDQVTATLADQRAHVEKIAEADRALIEAEQQVDAAKVKSAEASELCENLATQLTDIATKVSSALPVDIDLPTFLAWLAKLDAAQNALIRRDDKARDFARRVQAVNKARLDLSNALALAGRAIPDDMSLALCVETAQSLLDQVSKVEALSEAEAEARQNLNRRERSKLEADDARTAWQAEWEAACSDTWMVGAPPAVDEMRAILEELDQLREHQGRIVELTHRITAMQSNRERFEQAAYDLAGRLDMPSGLPVTDLWRDITRRQRAAESSEVQRASLSERLMTARNSLSELEGEAKIHRNRTVEFCRHFGVEVWAEARDALTKAGELSKLRETQRELTEDLCAGMQCDTVEEAREQLRELNVDALAARADSLRTVLKTLRTAQEEAQDGFRKAEDAVETVGGDDAVARLEEQRQTLLLEIEDGARRHLRQRLGLLAVDAALRSYRDTHRSGMLERASEAFRIMSRDRYSGLAAQPDGSREVLVALEAGSGSKQADQLSDGTRAQLYLALRIAGYHEFARNNGPVPFIADDIMESFDDDRTAEAFGLLAEMSKSGQVIYLTHHAHLCDIAKNSCPSVCIHELQG
ncbi:AAA family ATPase [uncultured Ruegeria sp.]|uniref:AAA family ATPase n=1 Tax=uncultured Ruegeria sp. TaxID=259304 RepID=UPI00262C9F9A|nr:AAA family ATPase [uncultured Ruegeria sp.]